MKPYRWRMWLIINVITMVLMFSWFNDVTVGVNVAVTVIAFLVVVLETVRLVKALRNDG